ncbi:MmgE/PrpD family protein [Roseomonas sp. NAR14]|uniref:MmgE/PrpD family protein n=1 Tax=Roseomonas acroporae TaxID=2937791 RepID=A0A9X1Y925_9PROT|nr:MmgE/PrpD family protein [Roseomonas acroporae]MCK8785778.1 MmgE/PrpD family protein [Roseomonas acroporae]
MTENPLLPLAEHAASWASPGRGRPLPPDLEHHARRALVDWFAALLAGASRPPATLLTTALAGERGGPGARSVLYTDGGLAPLRTAALVNATASHTVEFDDIYRDAGYHPGCPTIGAALAAAQDQGADMAALLRAVVAGYEVSCRIGLAVQPSHYRYWHTTGTVGTFGAATAVAVLLGCDAERTAHAIATAATMAGGLQQAFRSDGMSKPLHPGHAAEAGALAALAARAGVTGALDVLHGPVGFAAATSEDAGKWAKALDGLGERFAITSMTFKNHGCCGHIFAALDAVRDLQSEHGFGADAVAHIHVAGYGPTKEVCDRPEARTESEARFSAQYCVAALLRLGGVRLAAFEPANLADPAIHALMRRVSVSLAPDLADAYPARRAARVTVTLHGGRVLERYQPTRKGDPDAPLSDAELSEKFRELAGPAVGAARAAALLDRLWHGDALPGAVPLLAPMAAGAADGPTRGPAGGAADGPIGGTTTRAAE